MLGEGGRWIGWNGRWLAFDRGWFSWLGCLFLLGVLRIVKILGWFGRPAARHGAQAAAEESFKFGDEGVGSEGATAAGTQADPGEQLVLVGFTEDTSPLA